MIGIYRIINKINGKSYIGQSTDILRRWRVHRYKPFDKSYCEYDCVFYKAIRKYGLDNFNFTIIEECPINLLNDREKYWINYYRTYIHFDDCNGYNMTLGGDSIPLDTCVLKPQDVEEIYELLQNTDMYQKEIAKIYRVSESTISQINHGKQWINDKYQYPLRQKKTIKHTCVDCGKVIDAQATRCHNCSIKFKKQQFINSLPITKDELYQLLLDNNGNFTFVSKKFNLSANGLRKWCDALEIPRHSADYKTNVSKQKSRVIKHVIMIDINTNEELREFNNANEAARFLGKERGVHIHDVCNGKRKTAYGYKWRYA